MNDTPLTASGIHSREDLLPKIHTGLRPKYLLFWGHTPPRSGISNSCFSQWWAGHPFECDGIRYATTEHFMMAGKARLFEDHETLTRILAAPSAGEAKKLGRLVRNFDEGRWKRACRDIVVRGNLAKFSQHPALKEHLLNTGDKILVEASPYDRIWGIGMAAITPGAENPASWRGQNLLGFALMEVREQLRTAQAL